MCSLPRQVLPLPRPCHCSGGLVQPGGCPATLRLGIFSKPVCCGPCMQAIAAARGQGGGKRFMISVGGWFNWFYCPDNHGLTRGECGRCSSEMHLV
jgi:hypothetical protein